MQYDLSTLGWQNFEHVAQSLLSPLLNNTLSVFGSGRDGGREATWDGEVSPFSGDAPWSGRGVLQAKYQEQAGSPSENLIWLRREIKKELDAWKTQRPSKPEYLLIVTNARLSAAPGGGKDQISRELDNEFQTLGASSRSARVVDYDDLRVMLDNNEGVRRRYAGFITAGDVIAQLINNDESLQATFKASVELFVANNLVAASRANLSQAGSAADRPPLLTDVIVDLPYYSETIRVFDIGSSSRLTADLIRSLDRESLAEDGQPAYRHRNVIVGGPGQGKTTITQWLAQLYRLAFLQGTSVIEDPQIQELVSSMTTRLRQLDLTLPANRRWPVQVKLTDLADALSEDPSISLLRFIVTRVNFGATVQVSPEDLRSWLRSYPWLLILDGLDEVPVSSNRAAVIGLVRDFEREALTFQADVAIIATTRPQGYTNEFSPSVYRHYSLAVLDADEALDYATVLAAVRRGPQGSAEHRELVSRFESALADSNTRRLCETPLQITILIILLELRRTPPRDRYRLFLEYYAVIKKREQEKPGELAELLRDHDHDIDAIHERVGLLLQERAQESGDTSSTLPVDEFLEQITTRLRDQEFAPADIVRLGTQFKTLVTERLVLLTLVNGESVGFELRSLQEFMAAKSVLALEDGVVLEKVVELTASSFWRNVVLFICGGILADRERLAGELIVTLTNYDAESVSRRRLATGAAIALELLVLGAAVTQPKWARALAVQAYTVVEYGVPNQARMLAQIISRYGNEVVESRLGDTSAVPTTVWYNRLVAAVSVDRSRGSTYASGIVSALELDTLSSLTIAAIREFDFDVSAALEPRIGEVPVIRVINAVAATRGTSFSSAIPEYVLQLKRVFYWDSEDHTPASGNHGLEIIHRDQVDLLESWRWLREFSASSVLWHPLEAMAKAAISSDPLDFATFVETLVESPIRAANANGLPWFIASFFGVVETLSDDSYSTYIRLCASWAREGRLGTTEDWSSAESRLSSNLNLDDIILDVPVEDGFTLPAWKELTERGVPIESSTAFASNPSNIAEWVSDLERVLDGAAACSSDARRFELVGLAAFMASIAWDQVEREMPGANTTPEEPGRSLENEHVVGDLRRLSKRLLVDSSGIVLNLDRQVAWIEWLGAALQGNLDDLDAASLIAFAKGRYLYTPLRGAHVLDVEKVLSLRARAGVDAWWLERLVARFEPSYFNSSLLRFEGPDSPELNALQLLRERIQRPAQGELSDADIELISELPRAELRSIIQFLPSAGQVELALSISEFNTQRDIAFSFGMRIFAQAVSGAESSIPLNGAPK